ncbi:S-adenosylmethionine transporter [Tilletia horrida]|nr:S-adenosylmethionine transporter [Tilletia horrida]
MYHPAQRSAFPAAPAVGQPNPFASGPTTATASIQVHYLWVAGRYRDLSSERGLGLAAEAHSLGPIPELGDHSDHSGSRPASAHHLPLRHAPGAGAAAAAPEGQALAERKVNPFLDIRNFAADSGAKAAARSGGVHGARHGSLRTYAADRLKSQELLESRISRTTDVERLKWEAKSALLNGAHSLAVLLFVRAGSLGSISSCTMLTKIYSSGITRGASPRIIVIRRDPLRALAWDLEGLRLLQRRLEPTKYGAAVYSQSSSVSEAWSAEQPQGLEETFRCCELLIRLLRTSQAGLVSLSTEAAALPDIKAQKRLKSAPTASESVSNRRADVRMLWDEVAATIRWLETRLERSVALARHRASQPDPVADPDDEFDHDEAAEYLEALAVQLAYLRAIQALRTMLMVRSKEAIRAAKERWAQSLAAASSSHCPAGMDDVVPLAEAGLAFIHALPEDGWSTENQAAYTQAATDFTARLEEGLAELAVPAVSENFTADKESLKSTNSQPGVENVQATSTTTDIKSRNARKKERRNSLQEVPPVDVESVSDAARTKQINLTQRLVGASQPAVPGLVSVEARGQQHMPRTYSSPYQQATGESVGLGKAPSFTGLTTASFVGGRLTSPSVVGLDGGSIAPANKDPFLGPTRDLEGFTFPRHRRPSSVVSDTPSLLFPPSGDADDALSPSRSEDQGAHAKGATESKASSRPAFDRKRVVSMYGITPASGSKGASAPAERFSFPTGPGDQSPESPGITRTHRSPSGTTAQDALTNTLRNASSSASLALPAARSLFLAPTHGRSMSGQATDHLRKLRQQDAASTHSRMNSDAMSTLSRTLRHRTPSDAAKARPTSVLLAPSTSMRSLSTAPLPNSLQAKTSPTLSRASATSASALSVNASRSESTSTTTALGSLRKMGAASPRHSEPTGTSISASGSKSPTTPEPAPRASLSPVESRSMRSKSGKPRPAPLARAFESMDPTSRPSSVPHSPVSPNVPNGSFPPSPGGASAAGGALSPRLQKSLATPQHQAHHSRGGSTASSSTHAQQLDAALAEAEAKSRLHTEGTCSICGTRCENAPVSRTGERWCSRECRMEAKKRKTAGAGAGPGNGAGAGRSGNASAVGNGSPVAASPSAATAATVDAASSAAVAANSAKASAVSSPAQAPAGKVPA